MHCNKTVRTSEHTNQRPNAVGRLKSCLCNSENSAERKPRLASLAGAPVRREYPSPVPSGKFRFERAGRPP